MAWCWASIVEVGPTIDFHRVYLIFKQSAATDIKDRKSVNMERKVSEQVLSRIRSNQDIWSCFSDTLPGELVIFYNTLPGAVFSYKLRYIVGFGLVEMVISTNPKPTIYRNLYENTAPVSWPFFYETLPGKHGELVIFLWYLTND